MHDRREPVSWEYAASAIENLAKIHALSFAYQKEIPEEFENMCKDIVFEYPQDDDYKHLSTIYLHTKFDVDSSKPDGVMRARHTDRQIDRLTETIRVSSRLRNHKNDFMMECCNVNEEKVTNSVGLLILRDTTLQINNK
ncbi:ecdysteroid kinase domain-containing protein [Phthorimaea operculella]|nr:ecdysteroid kinase domain-containing protein [Phthorimaea operculella]